MKIEIQLDYKTILRNSSRPVHLVAKLTAPDQPLTQRARGTAFTVVLDRSGSMDGAPIEHAKRAAREVIKNLRPEDYFSLVVFDRSVQVVIPLEQPVNRFAGTKRLIKSMRVIRPISWRVGYWDGTSY